MLQPAHVKRQKTADYHFVKQQNMDVIQFFEVDSLKICDNEWFINRLLRRVFPTFVIHTFFETGFAFAIWCQKWKAIVLSWGL
jgi:hypothetical protein